MEGGRDGERIEREWESMRQEGSGRGRRRGQIGREGGERDEVRKRGIEGEWERGRMGERERATESAKERGESERKWRGRERWRNGEIESGRDCRRVGEWQIVGEWESGREEER